MNTKKIIFGIIAAIVLLFLIFLVTQLGNKQKTQIIQTNGDLVIWTLDDDENNFSPIIEAFKKQNPAFSEKNITVESFSDDFTYRSALINALIQGVGPDIFALRNTDGNIYKSLIAENGISANDFRLTFSPVFSDDLVYTSEGETTTEYVKGVPFGYEALGILYNRRYFLRPSELETWDSFILAMQDLKEKTPNIIPIALGNYNSVKNAASILSSFFVLEGGLSLQETTEKIIQQALAFLQAFGDKDGNNGYDTLIQENPLSNDIDFFTRGDVASIIAFPRDLLEIKDIGFQSSFLYASPFPIYAGKENKQAIFYKYFSLSNQSQNQTFAKTFLNFLASEQGQASILEAYPYYLPASTLLAGEVSEKKILSDYNVVYKNFINSDVDLVTYNEEDSILFNDATAKTLESSSNAQSIFSSQKDYIICGTTKSSTLLNLSSPCK